MRLLKLAPQNIAFAKSAVTAIRANVEYFYWCCPNANSDAIPSLCLKKL